MRRTRWDSMLQAPFYFCSYVSFSRLSFAMFQLPSYLFLSALLILSEDVLTTRAEGGLTATGPAVQENDNVNFILQEASASQQRLQQLQHQVHKASVATSGLKEMLNQLPFICIEGPDTTITRLQVHWRSGGQEGKEPEEYLSE
ncbi:hypothetical protein AAFF_G00351950 [Aldrovandia affinis]|uniref:Uncharacterized protein n=1 Tax=Aldrovandia affinis TaxID=143900 RepID=A0AAD7WNP8_9TELE|nr:hypothetical protein AAFF_G00351950 [Aldrovandia affinis]